MKKINRISLDQIAREYKPLSVDILQKIKGGTNLRSDCVAQAINLASTQIGCSVNMNAVTDTAIQMIMRDLGTDSYAFAKGYYSLNGLTGEQGVELFNRVFTDIAEGNCGSGSSTIGLVTTSANVKHAVVQDIDANGIFFRDNLGNRFETNNPTLQVIGTVNYINHYYTTGYGYSGSGYPGGGY